MNRQLYSSILLFLFIFLPSVFAKNTNETPKIKKEKVTNWQATFIELGSVNCIPCRMMQPVMEQIEKEYKDIVKVIFYDVWTQKDQNKAKEFNIRAIPTQIFLDKEGKEFHRHIGYYPFEEIEKIFASFGIKKKQDSKTDKNKK